jgi:hypothetical protein
MVDDERIAVQLAMMHDALDMAAFRLAVSLRPTPDRRSTSSTAKRTLSADRDYCLACPPCDYHVRPSTPLSSMRTDVADREIRPRVVRGTSPLDSNP